MIIDDETKPTYEELEKQNDLFAEEIVALNEKLTATNKAFSEMFETLGTITTNLFFLGDSNIPESNSAEYKQWVIDQVLRLAYREDANYHDLLAQMMQTNNFLTGKPFAWSYGHNPNKNLTVYKPTKQDIAMVWQVAAELERQDKLKGNTN